MKPSKRIGVIVSGLVLILISAILLTSTKVYAQIAGQTPTDTELQSLTDLQLIDVIQRSSAILNNRLSGTTVTPTATPTTTPTTVATPVPTTTTFQKEAWIYPGSPACNASTEFKSRSIHTLKAEYLSLDASGNLITLTETDAGCNGYTATNAQTLKSYSQEQYVTIGADRDRMAAMVNNSTLRTNFVNGVINFVNQIGFTGVDIDFEGFGQWSATDYSNYKLMVTQLGNALHNNGKKLQLDLPPIGNSTMQSYYPLKYEDFNTLPVDQYTIMAYDYQYDYGAGTAVQPISWMNSIIDWAKAKFTDDNKISIGIPSYGYQGATGGYNLTILTYDQAKLKPGFSTATRDADSKEMKWTNAGISYFYSDATTLDAKLAAVKAKGITQVSVWHLGGNLWFSQ